MTVLRVLAVLLAIVLVPEAQGALALDPIALQPDGLDVVEGESVESFASPTPEPDDERGLRFSTAIEIALLLTALSVLPALLISLTCFTRIVIVLSFVRRSMAVNELPPNPIVIGLALFLTSFVMAPVFERRLVKSIPTSFSVPTTTGNAYSFPSRESFASTM